MSQALLAHKFRVTRVPYTEDTDTTLNIKKRREQFLYAAQTNQGNVNLAYMRTKQVDTVNNFFVSDHSEKLVENRVVDVEATLFSGASFTATTDSFLLTDIFTETTTTSDAKPIYYQHLISRDHYDPDDSGHAIVSLQLLDTNLETIANPVEFIQSTGSYNDINYGIVYNNYINSFDEVLGLPTVYYIKYIVRKGSDLSTYVELLNNTPVFREATFDDLDEFSNLSSTRKTYILEDNGLGSFNVTISRSADYAYINQFTSRLRIIKPSLRTSNQPWFISIANSKFFATVPNQADPVKYEIAEFDNQIFSPYNPYKTITAETATSFDSNLFKLANSNIALDIDQAFFVTAKILDSAGTLKEIFTTDPSLIGTNATSIIKYQEVRSVDQLNGFIDLDVQIEETDSVVVSYIYEEKLYELIDINFNPANNRNILDETVVVYVIPQTTELARTLFYLRVDRSGKVIYSSEAVYGDTTGSDIAAQMTTSSGLFYNKGNNSFVERYTVESSTINSGNPMALILGECYVGEAFSNENVAVIDIRVRGGGILDLNKQEIIDRNLESLWNWDIAYWDGYPYPASASYYVEIPTTILTTASGVFTVDEARTVIEEHTALGVYAAIRTYSTDPIISGVMITTSGITLQWTYHGPDITYDIYQGLTQDGPFSRINNHALTETSYTITGLDSQTQYWFTVVGVDSTGLESLDSSGRYVLGLRTI